MAVCGECKFYLVRGVCPRAEYKKYDLNVAACAPTDKACKLFQPKYKPKKSDVLDMTETLEHLNNKYVFKVPTDTEEILGYEEGQYKRCKCTIKNELEDLYGEELTRSFVEEVLAHIQRANYIERSEINKFSNKIPVKNGLLNLLTREVEPFSSDQIFTYKLNVEYDPAKECPTWLKFVNQVLRPEDIPVLQEILGYCILPAMPFHKLFWFYGRGRNGKGRVELTLEYIFGPENCSQLNLGEFRESRRFAVAQLYGKLLNVSSEPDSKYSITTNILKLISGEDPISAELKGKNKRLQFVNKAKPLIIGNSFPKVEDTSEGFWERVIVLNFPFSFTGKDVVPNIERTWLENSDEVSGIFNWMLEGLYRLKENGEFSSSKTTEETKAEFMRVSDPFRAWLNDCCIFLPVGKVTRPEAYASYKEYADDLGANPSSARSFYTKMRQTPKIHEYRGRDDVGKFVRYFKGLTIRDLDESSNQPTLDDSVSDVSFVSSSNPRDSLESNKGKEVSTPVNSVTVGTIQECLETLRRTWNVGTYTDFDNQVVKLRGCSLEEAAQLRERWADEGIVGYDNLGLLAWVKQPGPLKEVAA